MRGRKYVRDIVEQKALTDSESKASEMPDNGTDTRNKRPTSETDFLKTGDHGTGNVDLDGQQACSRPTYQPPPEFANSKPGPSDLSQKCFECDPPQEILDDELALTAYILSRCKTLAKDSDLSDSDSLQINDESPRTQVVYQPNKGFMVVPALRYWSREPSNESLIEGIGVTRSRKGKEKAVGKGEKYTPYTPKKGAAVVEIEENNERFRSVQLEEKSGAMALDIDDYLESDQFRLEAITVVSRTFDKEDEAELTHEKGGATDMEPAMEDAQIPTQMVACVESCGHKEVLGFKKTETDCIVANDPSTLQQTEGVREEVAIFLEDYIEEEEEDVASIKAKEAMALKEITQTAGGDVDKEDKRDAFVAEESLTDVDLTDSATELTKNTASLKKAVSSLMFIPCGLSSGPFPLQSSYAVRNLNAQTSFESEISDQAPELEMDSDVFGIGAFFQT